MARQLWEYWKEQQLGQQQQEEVDAEGSTLQAEVLCAACSGSGEGQYDGTRCGTCKGKGVVYHDED